MILTFFLFRVLRLLLSCNVLDVSQNIKIIKIYLFNYDTKAIHIMTILIMTLLTMTILITLNTGDITCSDNTYIINKYNIT
jgi:hypothetical protein